MFQIFQNCDLMQRNSLFFYVMKENNSLLCLQFFLKRNNQHLIIFNVIRIDIKLLSTYTFVVRGNEE